MSSRKSRTSISAPSAPKSSARGSKVSLADLDDDQIKTLVAEYAKNKKSQAAAKKKNKAAVEEAAVQQSEREYQRKQAGTQSVESDSKDSGDDDDADAALARKTRKHGRSDSDGDISDSSVTEVPSKKTKTSAVEIEAEIPHALKKAGGKKKQPSTGQLDLEQPQQSTTVVTGPFTPYARKVNPNAANKPRGEDFTPTSKRMIDEGKNSFAVYLATQNAFPKDDEAFAKVDSIFESSASAAEKTTQTARRGARFNADELYKKDVRNAIKNSMSAFRGRVVEAAEPLVESTYEMKKKKESKESRAKRVKELLEGGLFAFEDTDKREGFLGSEILAELFSKTFLYRPSNKKQGLGFGQHAIAFKEVPNHLLAFLLTAIECALRHWITGAYKEEKFDSNVYDEVYDAHLDSIEFMQNEAPDYMQELKSDIWNSSCELAGVQPTIIVRDADDENDLGYIAKDDVNKLTRRRKKTSE